jgi:hypothetical protein
MESLCVFTPVPPNLPLWLHCDQPLTNFMEIAQMDGDFLQRCCELSDELSLDMRINAARSMPQFSSIVPCEESYEVCIWIKDSMGVYYSFGKIRVDATHLKSAGCRHIIRSFRLALKGNSKSFEYKLSSRDKESYPLLELFHSLDTVLRMNNRAVVRRIPADPNVLNIVT